MADTLPETPPPCNVDTLVEHLFGPRPEYRAAIGSIADKARAALPECNGRVDAAVKMVLAGDVDLHLDGSATVGSATDPTAAYEIVNGRCACADFARAPHGFCKHRLSAAIARRARELTQTSASPAPIATPVVPVVPLPEASVSITLKGLIHGQEVMVTLRGLDFGSVQAQVEEASQWLDATGSRPPPTPPPAPSTA